MISIIKKFIIISFLIVVNSSAATIYNLEQDIIHNIHNTQDLHSKTIAVYDIKVVGSKDDRLKYIANEKITNALIKSKLIKVVQRKSLKAYITEHQLSLSEIAEDKENSSKKILIADFLLTGTVYKKQDFYEVNIQISDSQTMEIVATIKNIMYDDNLKSTQVTENTNGITNGKSNIHTKSITSVNDIEIYYHALFYGKSFLGIDKKTELQKINRLLVYYNEELELNNQTKIVIKSYSNKSNAYNVAQKVFKLLKGKGISRSKMIIKSFNNVKCEKRTNSNCDYLHTKILFEFI